MGLHKEAKPEMLERSGPRGGWGLIMVLSSGMPVVHDYFQYVVHLAVIPVAHNELTSVLGKQTAGQGHV